MRLLLPLAVTLASAVASATPLRLGTAENSVEPGATVQVRVTGRDDEVTPELRRLRLFARSTLGGGLVRLGVQLGATPVALELIDLWAEVNAAPWAEGTGDVRIGQHRAAGAR